MHGTEPRWNIDFQMGGENERVAYSVNDYADLFIKRKETAHEIVRKNLGVIANKMSAWYDKKVHTQSFLPGNQVFVLNLKLEFVLLNIKDGVQSGCEDTVT